MQKRFSRLDLTTAIISLALIVTVALTAVLANPARRGPRVAYLFPAVGGTQNIVLAEVNNPANKTSLTAVDSNIYDFDISRDGKMAVYALHNPEVSVTDLKLVYIQTGENLPLLDCAAADADCKGPVFSPDSATIAYERVEMNSTVPGVRPGAIRIWLLDRAANTTRPLFAESQIIGHSPEWSLNGRFLGFFTPDSLQPGVIVHDFQSTVEETSMFYLPATQGRMGTFAPEGDRLIVGDASIEENRVVNRLKIANLMTGAVNPLFPVEEPANDVLARWNPDGRRVAIARQYLDERQTRGHQLFLLDTNDGATKALVVDENYTVADFKWNAAGDMLLLQRIRVIFSSDADSRLPEVWVYDLEDGSLQLIAENAFLPSWVEGDS